MAEQEHMPSMPSPNPNSQRRSAESYYQVAVGQVESRQHVPTDRRPVAAGNQPTVPAEPGAAAEPTGVPVSPAAPPGRARKSIDIREELARRERIKNDDAEQDILLKRRTLNLLFYLLFVETLAIFVLSFMQAVHAPWHFAMQDSSFKILVGATILQITAMLSVAVAYLFPRRKHDQ